MAGLIRSFETLTCLGYWVISPLCLSHVVNLLVKLCSSGGPFADSDSAGTSFSLVVSQSASSTWWAGPSTPSVTISKETFSPLFFAGSERGWSLH